jgi:hypothetical protein
MAGQRLRRVAAVVAVAATVGAGTAVTAAADGLTGSPAAVRVARQVLAHTRHVIALRWLQGGDQWECPSPDGTIVGPAPTRPSRDCRRAVLSFDENLRNGAILRSQSTMTVSGHLIQSELVSGAGDWVRAGRAHCWDAESAMPGHVSAFSYSGERLSITAQTARTITLRGTELGFQEIDTIDAHTFAVREVDERIRGAGDATARLVAHFTELPRPFALPTRPRHICSDIVRFPTQPAR